MPQYQLLQYNGPVLNGDTGNSNSSVAVRDIAGGLAAKNLSGTNLQSTGTIQAVAPPTITTTKTIDGSSTFWVVDGTSGVFTATLPAASTVAGFLYVFTKKDAANNVTIKGNGSELIDGANTSVMSSQYGSLRVISDGTQWWTW